MGEGIFKLIWIVPVFIFSVGSIIKEMALDTGQWIKNKTRK